MRITFLCSSHSLGDERVVCRHALSLAKKGHSVTVLARGDRDKQPPSHPNLLLESVEPFIRGASFQARLARIRCLRKLYRATLRSKPDVVIANEPDSLLIGIILKAKARIPLVFDVHEYYEELLASRIPRPFSSLTKKICKFFLSRLALRCDWIMVVSDDMASRYELMRDVCNVTTILNSPPIEAFPKCNHLAGNIVALCHEGWLDQSRGMQQLIEAVAIARKTVDVRLLVVGSIRNECQAHFSELIEKYSLQDAVTVTGWVPYDKVGSLDAQAQIGLVTLQPSGNNYRGLSNKLFSYMACGQAVIVPYNSASHALVDSCNGGVAVDVTAPPAIAEAIINLTRNPKYRQQLGENNRRAIIEKYGWNVMATKLETIVSELYSNANQ